MIVVEKALADIFWQSAQWHAIVITAGAMIRKRTAPQRQPASQGKGDVAPVWWTPQYYRRRWPRC
jgi:hypothetical protein